MWIKKARILPEIGIQGPVSICTQTALWKNLGKNVEILLLPFVEYQFLRKFLTKQWRGMASPCFDLVMLAMERLTVLRSLEIFRTIPDPDLEKLASILQEKEVPGGEDIIREGEMGTSMFVIVEGRVRVHVQGKQVGILGSGSVIGELAALDPEPRSASVTAINDTFLFELDGDALRHLMSERAGVLQELIHILCQRVRSSLPK